MSQGEFTIKTYSVRQCVWIHATLRKHQMNVHKLEAGHSIQGPDFKQTVRSLYSLPQMMTKTF